MLIISNKPKGPVENVVIAANGYAELFDNRLLCIGKISCLFLSTF